MHKRKISTRAGAWVLSAAMLFNGMPLSVLAESGDEYYAEAADTEAGGEAPSDIADAAGDSETQDTVSNSSSDSDAGNESAEGTTGEENSGAGQNAGNTEDNGNQSEAGNSGETAGTSGTQGGNADTAAGASDNADAAAETSQDENNNSDVAAGKADAEADTSDASDTDETEQITFHDALFQVLWSDENNLTDRRDDLDLSRRFIVYQNGQPMEAQPQIFLDREMEEAAGGTRLGTYRVQGLPDVDENGIAYTYSIREDAPAGYEAFTAEAFTDLDAAAASALLAQLITPEQELPVTLAEGDDLYRADKMFGNYLRQYIFSGSIIWNDNANQQTVRPDMESWFQNHLQITRDGAAYKSFRVHYEQNADDESVWNYQIKGLFAVKENRTQATYVVTFDNAEGYQAATNEFIVNGNQTDCQTVFELMQADSSNADESETTPDMTEISDEAEASDVTDTRDESSIAADDVLPQAASITSTVSVMENNGSARLTAAFLDKADQGSEAYNDLVSRYGIILSYTVENKSVDLKLSYANGTWSIADVQQTTQLAEIGLTKEALEQKINSSWNWTLGTGTLNLTDLPSKAGTDSSSENSWKNVSWNLSLAADTPENAGTRRPGYYAPIHSTDTNIYTFIPYESFSFTLDLREGSTVEPDNGINKILNNFTLTYGNSADQKISLAQLKTQFPDAEITWNYPDETDPSEINVTINNLKWCNETKTEYVYSISTDTITSVAGLETVTGTDTLVPRYDNSQSSNFGSKTDKCYNNGILYLTLTGDTGYQADKIWLDENKSATPAENAEGRPSPTWTLWRYPEKTGADYKTASIVTVDEKLVTWSISNTVKADESVTYGTSNNEENSGIILSSDWTSGVNLPKYDADGYPYVYFIRETGNTGGNQYEQVFGKIKAGENGIIQTKITGDDPYKNSPTTRGEDSSVYNGGTLSNRITGSTETSLKKQWINSAHQDNIQNVVVEFTLQSAYESDADANKTWTTVKNDDGKAKQINMSDFRSEIQEQEESMAVPQYDALGRKLVYRWVETNVYEVNAAGEKISKVPEEGWDKSYNPPVVTKFVLNCNTSNFEDGNEYYISRVVPMENGGTKVQNVLEGETTYFVDKLWLGWDGSNTPSKTAPESYKGKKIKVVLYQDGVPYTDSEGKTIEYKIGEDSITTVEVNGKKEERPWSLLIENLPKYDSKGRKHIYYAVEKNNDTEISSSFSYNLEELDKYSVNNAQIVNSKGENGKLIRVEKKWLDDGDIQYRMPVKVGIWRNARADENADKYLGNVTLTSGKNWWTYFEVNVEDNQNGDTYYIREWSIGDQYLVYTTYGAGSDTNSGVPVNQQKGISTPAVRESGNTVDSTDGAPARNVVVDYVDTDEYRYDVTYSFIPGSQNASVNPGEDQDAEAGIFSVDTYCVTNHRYGWINLTVTKKWIDEGQTDKVREELGAVLQLSILNSGELTDVSIDGDYVKANGISYPVYSADYSTSAESNTIAGSQQQLGKAAALSPNKTETIGFYNLPKFDAKGVKIRYKVTELAPKTENGTKVKEDGKDILTDVTTSSTTLSDQEYSSSSGKEKYTVVSGKMHALDTQEVAITNKRSAVRNVIFYKLWVDQAIKDKRPDIFFTLYQAVGDEDPQSYGRFKPYQASRTADGAFLKYIFEDMPKYDENGAEITYFAAESMHVDGTALEYLPVQYYYPVSTPAFDSSSNGLVVGLKETYVPANLAACYAAIGYTGNAGTGKYTVTNADSANKNVRTASDTNIAVLRENGIFVNEIRNTAKVSGKKIWKNVLEGFPENQLPPLNFDLIQTDVNGNSETVAKFSENITTDAKKTEFAFEMQYLGQNSQEGEFVKKLDGTSVSENDTWQQLLPKYDKNGNIYTYTLQEQIEGFSPEETQNLYDRNVDTNSFLVDNTFKDGTGSVTIEKSWTDWYQGGSYSGQHPDITFNIYRFFETADGYTAPVKVASKKLQNGTGSVTFDKLNIYAPDGKKCYYYIEEVVPNGYENVAITLKNVSNSEEITLATEQEGKTFPNKETNTSSVFTFKGQYGTGGNVETATGTFQLTNKYKEDQDSITLNGSKNWDDINNDFNTRPDTIKIQVYRRADAQGTNNAIPANSGEWENVLVGNDNDTKITIRAKAGDTSFAPNTATTTAGTRTLNTKTITVSYRADSSDANKWTYTISGLDKYAPNGNPWIYKVVETPVVVSDNSTGAEIKYDEGTGESTQKNVSASETTMTDLNNTLETTSLTVQKKWENQHGLVADLASVTVDLWVKVGDASYVKASDYIAAAENGNTDAAYFVKALADQKLQLSQTITGNGSYTFQGLPKVLKTVAGIQNCQYVAVESVITYKSLGADNTYTDTTVTLNPVSVEVNNETVTVTYDHSNSDTLIYTIGYARDAATGNITITNVLPDPHRTSISFKKVWVGDSSNKFKTRPTHIRVELYRAEGPENGGAEQYKPLPSRLYWNLALDGDKISKNQIVDHWTINDDGVATLSGLPAKSPDGTKTYNYKVVEIGASNYAGSILEIVGKDTSRKDIAADSSPKTASENPGYYEITYGTGTETASDLEIITNSLATVDLTVTKAWSGDADGDIHNFRPETVTLTLWRCERNSNATPNYSTAENITGLYGNAPTWTDNQDNTWTCTYENLPKYYGVTKTKTGYQGNEYYYYVKEANQSGYLDGVTTAHSEAGDSPQTVTLTNTATVFQMNKTDIAGNSIWNRDLELTLTGKTTDNVTKDYRAIWSRKKNGNNFIEAVSVQKYNSGTGNWDIIYSESASAAESSVSIKGLPVGTYQLEETGVPDGYEKANLENVTVTLSSTPGTGENITPDTAQRLAVTATSNDAVTVVPPTANGTTTAVPVLTVADIKTSLNVIKTDGDQKLSGAEFVLKPAENSHFANRDNAKEENGLTFTVDENGIVNNPTIGELIIGNTYILAETKAPAGYILPDEAPTITFKVNENGTIETVATSSAGYISIPTTGETANRLIKVKNDPVKFSLEKKDVETGSLLEGAEFTLYKGTDAEDFEVAESNKVTTLKTDSNGKLTFETTITPNSIGYKLTTGRRYKLVEIKAPVGYETVGEISFVINENGTITYVNTQNTAFDSTTQTFTVKDPRKTGSVVLVKKNGTSGLNGVEFQLLKKDTDGKYQTYIQEKLYTGKLYTYNAKDHTITETAENVGEGYLKIRGLEWGNYKLTEITALPGYSTSDSNGKLIEAEFSILRADFGDDNVFHTVEIGEITNRETVLQLYKKAKNGNENDYLAGATFKIKGTFSDNVLQEAEKTLTTTADGKLILGDDQNELETLMGLLIGGNVYEITEIIPPAGYKVIPGTLKFRMNTDGSVEVVQAAVGYTVTSNGQTGNLITAEDEQIKVYLKKFSENGSTPLAGAKFEIKPATGSDKFVDGTTDVICIDMSKAAESEELDGKLVAGNSYTITEILAPDTKAGEYAKANPFTFKVNEDGSVSIADTNRTNVKVETDSNDNTIAVISISNHPFETYVDLKKTDSADDKGIAGTEFTLYRIVKDNENNTEREEEVEKQTTDANGKLLSKFMIRKSGTYRVKETKAADGYEYNSKNPYTATFTVANTMDFQGGTLKLADKVDQETKNKYAIEIDGEFISQDSEGNEIRNSESVVNKRLSGSVTLMKVDKADHSEKINDITFGLYNQNGEELGASFQTGKAYKKTETGWKELDIKQDVGTLTISGLDWGSYYVKEITADRYILSSDTYPFTIGYDNNGKYVGVNISLEPIENEKNHIQIAKAQKNVATGKYLAGAGFVLTGPDGFQKQAWFSTEDAKVFSGLPVGVYTLTETKAPVGYKRNTASMSFRVNADGTITDALGNTIANNLVVMEDEPTELVIQKTDEEGENLSKNVLKQVELTLTDETLESALEEINTKEPAALSENEVDKKTATITLNMNSDNPYVDSANGGWKLTGVLSVGHTYRLAETAVPTNYLIAEPVLFTVGENGAIAIISGTGTENGNNLYFSATEKTAQKLQIQDTEIKATVEIIKQDSEADKDKNHKKLENVEFKFYHQKYDSPDLSENTRDTLIKNGDEEIWKTNADGKITIENLSEGSYYFREVKADGYIYNPDKVYRVTVGKTETNQKIAVTYGEGFKKNESDIVEPVIENAQNVLNVKKLDGNGRMLSEKSMNELELTLTDITEATEKNPGTTIVKLTTAANDKYTYDPATATWTLKGQLIQGHTYRLSETGRPYGYLIASDITFTMGETGNIQVASGAVAEREPQSGENTGKNLYTETSLTVTDVQIKGSVELTKYQANADGTASDVLKGVTFDLYRIKGSDAAKLDKLKKDPANDVKINDEPRVTDGNGKIIVSDLPEGSYYFLETSAPSDIFMDGEATEIATIDASWHGKIVPLEKTDEALFAYADIFKVDNFDGEKKAGIEGTQFTLYKETEKKDGEKVFEKVVSDGTVNPVVTDADGKAQFPITEAGTYQIKETKAAYGYKYDEANAYTQTFTVTNTTQNQEFSFTAVNERQTGSVTLSKKDNTDPQKVTDLDGVTFTLYKTGESQAVGEFQTGKAYQKNVKAETGWEESGTEVKAGTLTISGLEWGSYYLTETKADGYVLSDTKYEFTIGNILDEKAHSGLSVNLGTVYNEKIRGSLLLKKKDGKGNPLENAVFTLYKMKGTAADVSADDKLQENLTTDKNGEILVENLLEGSYYFVETAAPDNVFMDGRSSDVAVIDQSVHGKTVEVDMVNTDFQASVELLKTDADTGAALAGVEFTLYRKAGEAYIEVSRQETGTDGKTAFTLNQAGSYKLVETIGAYGYDYDSENPYTAEFTITNTADFQNNVLQLADGVSEAVAKKYSVKISGNLSQNTASVTNKKTPAEETGSITVTKYLQLDGMTNGLELGTADSTFYTALFTDAEGTRRYSDVKALHIQNGTSASVTFDGLPKGIYYVFETLADGTSIPYQELTADINGNQYYCTGIGTENIAISPQQKEASAELYNWYLDLPDGYYMSGRLEITKNVLKNGETTETDDTFYAGIFDEAGNLVTVAELLQNDTVTVDAKLGGADNTQPVTYTVKETDKDGNPLDESFPYDIEISGDGSISRGNPVGQITIINTVREEEPEPTKEPTKAPTQTPTPELTQVSEPTQSAANVKTSDTTDVAPFVLMFILSGCILIFVSRKRRKSA